MNIFIELIRMNELIRVMDEGDMENGKGFFDGIADACEEKCSLI